MNDLTLDTIAQIEAINASDTDALKGVSFPSVVIPNSSKLLDIEFLQKTPNRLKAKFDTRYIEQLALYLDDKKDTETSAYIDEESMTAVVILDGGTISSPDWGDNTATLKLKQTEAFKAVRNLSQRSSSQQTLIDFIEDWHENIVFYASDDSVIEIPAAITAIRKMEVKNHKETSSELEFVFTCVPYEGLGTISMECSIRLVSVNDTPHFSIRVKAQEKIIKDISEDFKQVVGNALAVAKTYIGTINYNQYS